MTTAPPTPATARPAPDGHEASPVGASSAAPKADADDTRWWRACAAVLAAALVACLFYAIDRSRAAIVHGPPDPLSITASTRIEYFWRIGIGAFLAASTGLGLWLYPPRDPQALTLRMARWAVPITIACSIASFIWP